MKKKILTVVLIFFIKYSFGQVSGSFNVGGDIDKFYPVTFYDGGWINNVSTQLTIGRSDTHTNSLWRGALMADFTYHVSNYGHGANFIEGNLMSTSSFVAGWHDATPNGTCLCIIIWLKGGGSTYYYQSNYGVNPTVYDGTQNGLPYNEVNGPSHNFKTSIEEYATTSGMYQNRNAYFGSNVGIGTTNPTSKLTVAGNIASREVKVTVDAGADFVFEKDYDLPSLESIDKFIKKNKHLPEIASAQEMQKDGINLSEMNIKLLQKIEEMTLYMIEMKKENEKMKKENQTTLERQINLERRINNIENK